MGFIGIESVDSTNNAVSDSFNSEDGSYGGSNVGENGGLCSKGTVTLSSGADVYGNVQGSSINQSPGSGTTISGSSSSTPISDNFDAIDFSEVGADNNENIERGPTWAPPFYDPDTQDLVINNGRSLTLTSGVYYFRNITLAGGSTLNIDGDVTVYIEQVMTFDNGTVANLSQNPDQFHLNVGEGPVNIQGGQKLHAVIYAPEADVSLANGSGFYGGIIGKTLSFAGGGGLHYDESLSSDQESSAAPKLVY